MITAVRLCACVDVGARRRFLACFAGHRRLRDYQSAGAQPSLERDGTPDLSAVQWGGNIEASNARRHSRQLSTAFRSKRRNSLTKGGEGSRHFRECLGAVLL
jgi:hypothetical protein